MHEVRSILAHAQTHSEVVLGTLVDVLGSSYRLPGARVLITPHGTRVGLISGGCLEKDVVRHAWSWTAQGPQTAVYDTRSDDVHPHGMYGSGCDGVVLLLLERIHTQSTDPLNPLHLLRTLHEADREAPVALATVYSSHEFDPSKYTGMRIFWDGTRLVYTQGLSAALVDEVTPFLYRALTDRPRRPISVCLREPGVRVLVEVFTPPPELLICGAGDDARPLYTLALQLGWRVCVADKWPALVTSTRFPSARLVCGPSHELVQRASPSVSTYAVVMTHNFEDDATLLPDLLRTKTPCIGLMGPRKRTAKLMAALHQRDHLPSPEDLARIQTPVGVDLGADDPGEVALSVLSGMIAHRNQRRAGLLRDLDDVPIHPPHQRIPTTDA